MIWKFNDRRLKNLWDTLTGDETWMFQYEPETKQQWAVQVFQGEDPPFKFKRTKCVRKQVVASFFGMGGHIATIPLEDHRTVTAD